MPMPTAADGPMKDDFLSLAGVARQT